MNWEGMSIFVLFVSHILQISVNTNSIFIKASKTQNFDFNLIGHNHNFIFLIKITNQSQ